ncbi:MAG TPA: flagellar biosynthesis protein FliQ [Acidobacteriota bacterium]|nr:flagellar biosynthesis protein FliQ [Acidobacteriota bacterium]HOB54089.1 flagellar biosynthesis protein FliQ [Acidobacteriota bacterium]HQM62896.1 flagellar biosynthesis protein FliQ [Acidobacteriota bacterium]
MVEQLVLKVFREGLLMVLILSAGPIVLSMVVGLAISLFQAVTQIHEQTLTFVPKILTVFLSLAVLGPWMISQMVKFTAACFTLIANLPK